MKLYIVVVSFCSLLLYTEAGISRSRTSKDQFFDVIIQSPYENNEIEHEGKLDSELFFKKSPTKVKKPEKFTPDWSSLDARPLPSWYDDAKFGIFIHWGVFSVPSFGSEWFWINWANKGPNYVDFMEKNYPPNFKYQDFAPQFTAEFFDPMEWAEIFKNSGAKYIVLTSKHHEGYTLWPSKYSWNWNAMDVGPKRDLVGDLANAIRNSTSLKFGLYHSLYEWFHPLYLADKTNKFQTQSFVEAKTMPELYEIVNAYKPSVIWSDGDWETNDVYWNATNFLAWLYNDSPVKDEVVVNDRWGSGVTCKHGDFYTCTDHYNPGTLQAHKWENCLTLDKHSWGYRRNAPLSDYHTTLELLTEMAETISCGGNMLLNVGPTRDGRISPIFEERLRQIGQWLSVNGEAIYSTRPWVYQNDTMTSNIWYTASKDQKTVYAIVLFWPEFDQVDLGAPSAGPKTKVSFLGYDGNIDWADLTPGIQVSFPSKSAVANDFAWVIRMDQLEN